MSPAETRQHATFTALLWALSYPGRPQRLPAGGRAAFAAIAEALLDLETGAFSPDAEFAALIARSGARLLPPQRAPYHFYPAPEADSLESIAAAPVGSYTEPELGATLVLSCHLGGPATLTLRGPGIAGSVRLRVGGLPEDLWLLRAERTRFPLGWDLLLIDGAEVVGLPRSTAVEVG